jgi:hypothetical protein
MSSSIVIFDVIPVLQVIGLSYVITVFAYNLRKRAHALKLNVNVFTSLSSNTVVIYNIYQTVVIKCMISCKGLITEN